MPQIDSDLTAEPYVDNAIDEPSFLRLDPDEKLKQDSIFLNSTLTSPKTTNELPNKNYVDSKFNDPIKDTEHIDLNDRNFTNARFIQVNQLPQIDTDLTAKLYVDNAIDEPSLLRLDPVEKMKQGSIIFISTLTSSKTKIELPN